MNHEKRVFSFIGMALLIGVFIIVAGTGTAAAETRIGGKLGLAASNFTVQSQATGGAERVFRNSVTMGGFVHRDLMDRIGVQLELSGTNRGPRVVFNGSNIANYSLDYLDLAVLGTFEARLSPLSVYLMAGPTAHVLIRARFKNISGDTPVVDDISDTTAPYDLGITAGAGISLGPYSWGTLFLESRFTAGFIDVDTGSDDVTFHNRTITATLGYRYAL
jgi:hypothetical protein